MNVYIGTSGELKNAYIGEYIPWTPDASRTLLYLPLESNATDYSWNSVSTTPSDVTYASLWWVMCANANGSSSKISINSDVIPNWATAGTISAIVYLKSWTSNDSRFIEYNRPNAFFWLNYNSWYAVYCVWQTGVVTTKVWEYNQWIHMLATFDSSWYEMYCNWVLVNTWSSPSNVWWNPLWVEQNRYIFSDRDGIHNFWNWWGRELILENKKRSADDVSKYYQRIKAKLWF